MSLSRLTAGFTGLTGALSGFRQNSAFTPSLTALELWYDASVASSLFQNSNGTTPATANADPVQYMGDLSGNGRNVIQATGAKVPTLRTAVQNGRNVVRFDGGDVLANATPLVVSGGQYTVYFVYRGVPTLADGCAFQNGATNEGFGIGFGGSGGVMVGPADYLAAAKQGVAWVPTGLFHETLGVMVATYDGSGVTGSTAFRRNGVDGTSANGAKLVDATAGTFIGAGSLTTLFATMDLCEFLLYSVKHDAATIAEYEAGLQSQWGIS